MIVKKPTSGEVERAAEIAAIAFPNLPLEHWQRSFHSIADVFGEKFILVVELDGQLVSSMVCTPGPIYAGEGTVSHSAVGAVGTLPECRKTGCAGAMMTESVKLLRSERMCTSSLWPFSYTYYRKFGWEMGSETRSYTGLASDFAVLGSAESVRGANADDLEAIMLVYDEYAHAYNCLTQRNSESWLKFFIRPEWLQLTTEPGYGCLVHVVDDILKGYAFYQLEVKEEEKRYISVKEMVYDEPQVRRDLLAGLAGLAPEGSINFGAPIDDLFLHELPNPRVAKGTAQHSFMFRIIDPPAAMQSLESEFQANGRLSLSISDPVFAEGFEFGLEIDNGKASLCPYDPKCALEMDVQTLAKLYTGCITPLQAWYLGKIKLGGDSIGVVAFAEQVFSSSTPYRSWLEPG